MSGPGDIDQVLLQHNIDAIIAPTESRICTIAAFAGYPIGTMPLGYLQPTGRPHGLSILASAHQEAKILGIMHAYEKLVFSRVCPPLLEHFHSVRRNVDCKIGKH